ncbi:MAG: cyclodeaminase [Acidimicrobiia bacterium]
MPEVRVLVEADLRETVGMGEAELEAISAVYPLISSGTASMPPIMRVDVPEHNGEIDIKSAYLPGYAGIAVKVSTGFFDNPTRGLPSLGGLMLVFDAETGVPRSALFDNGYLTDLRTALAGAVAARELSRPDAHKVGVIGAGAQARLQLEALRLVRDIDGARVWARRADEATIYALEMSERLGIEVTVADSIAEAASDVDILVTATPATDPLVTADMVQPGSHLTSVGSDAEHKQELAADVVTTADRFVCDTRQQSMRLGELRAAIGSGFDPSQVVELGEVIAGSADGRRRERDITICDLTGTGAQDTAIASLAVERCVELGLGVTFETAPR